MPQHITSTNRLLGANPPFLPARPTLGAPGAPAMPLRFGSEAPCYFSDEFHESQKLHLAAYGKVRAWRDRLIDALDLNVTQAHHALFPVSVPKLQMQVNRLLTQSKTGLPVALLRAQAIRMHGVEAFLPYEAFQEKAVPKESEEQSDTLNNLVHSEASAYLASHLIALESAMAAPQQELHVAPDRDTRVVQLGLKDAQTVLSHRAQQADGRSSLISDNLYQLILASPKILLHEHYRGCAPMSLIRTLFLDEQRPRAYTAYNALQDYCRTDRLFTRNGKGPLYKPSLNRFRWKNDNLVSAAIYSNDTAYLGAYLYALKLGMENVRYFEYRLNPISKNVKDPILYARCIQQGLDDAAAFLWKARGQKIDSNLIFSADRQEKPGVSVKTKRYDSRVTLALQVLATAIRAKQQGIRVTGFDIQGDEEHHAITDFEPVARMLRNYNRAMVAAGHPERRIGATIHAGETPFSGRKKTKLSAPTWKASTIQLLKRASNWVITRYNAIMVTLGFPHRQGSLFASEEIPTSFRPEKGALTGPQSIRKAIELFWDENTPVRIGHGLQVVYDPALIQLCRERQIGFEQCPKSNIQTGAASHYRELPTLTLSRDHGLMINISTDNATTCKTNSCNERVKVTRYLGARHPDRKKFEMDGIAMAFEFDTAHKTAVTEDMQETYRRIEHDYQRVITMEIAPPNFRRLLDNQVPLIPPAEGS